MFSGLAWLLLLAAPRLPAQATAPNAQFATAFKRAVDKLYEVAGTRTERRVAAKSALDLLDAAGALIPGLPGEKKRRAQLKFFVEVRRAEVYWRLDTDIARPRAVEIGKAARTFASGEEVYYTYYRALLLILLSNTMDERDFLQMLEDGFGDGEYLRGDLAKKDVEKMREGYSGYLGHLLLLRAWIDLTRRPAFAESELRKLGLELKQYGESRREIRDECYSRLAWHFIELRDFERAKVYLGEIPSEDSRYPRAVIDYKQGNFDFAAEEAAKLCEEDDQPRSVLLHADAIEGQARVARANDDPAKALRLFTRALQRYSSVQATADAQIRAASLNGQGDCYLGLGDLDLAERVLTLALKNLEKGRSWTELAERTETLKDLGRLAELRKDPAKALDLFTRALAGIEEIRKDIPLDALGIAWLEPSQLEAIDGVIRLAQSDTDAASGTVTVVTPTQALATIDRMKARGLLDWLESPPSSENLDRYRTALDELAKARSAADARAHRLKLESLRTSPDARSQATALTDTEITGLLDRYGNTVFLSYWMGRSVVDPRVYLVSAHGSKHVVVHDLGPAADGRKIYRDALAAVRRPEGDPWPALDAAARFLLPATVSDQIAAGAPVVVCADTELADLPVEALRIDGQALGIRNPVHRTPSLAVFARLASRAAGSKTGGTLIFDTAQPTAEQQELHELSRLEFSEAEGDLVGRAHPAHVRMRMNDATYSNLKTTLRTKKFDNLHVSCHAINHPRIPSASLLMLNDGPLDMGTLATLPMKGMLVVFSSCSSAGGRKAGGEGVKGLLWGPLGAGARAVVASHWEMNQQATKDLMGQFHFHLAKGVEEGEAMRRARETLAQNANYAHPTYWAGFGIYAAPRPGIRDGETEVHRPTGSSIAIYLLGIALAGVVAIGLFWRRRG